MKKPPREPSPRARAAGIFAGSLAISVLVCGLTSFLAEHDFPPLRPLVAFDERLFFQLAPPTVRDDRAVQTVVMVDIDDGTMAHSGSATTSRVPRVLIARLLNKIRSAEPAVIFADLDLRDNLVGDDVLKAELARDGQALILLPAWFSTQALPLCEKQSALPAAKQPALVDAPLVAPGSHSAVRSVHALLEPDSSGIVEGVCTAYRLRTAPDVRVELPAAMAMAVQVARTRDSDLVPTTEPRLVRSAWLLRNKQSALQSSDGARALYVWVPAASLDVSSVNLGVMKNAIVILSATHEGADDLHPTPVGSMSGALVHANLALDLQLQGEAADGAISVIAQLAFDLGLTAVAIFLVVRYVWGALGLDPGLTKGLHHRLARVLLEVIVVTGTLVVAAGGLLIVARFSHQAFGWWRYAFLSSLVGAVLVFLIESLSAIGEAVGAAAERRVDHPRSKRSKGKRT